MASRPRASGRAAVGRSVHLGHSGLEEARRVRARFRARHWHERRFLHLARKRDVAPGLVGLIGVDMQPTCVEVAECGLRLLHHSSKHATAPPLDFNRVQLLRRYVSNSSDQAALHVPANHQCGVTVSPTSTDGLSSAFARAGRRKRRVLRSMRRNMQRRFRSGPSHSGNTCCSNSVAMHAPRWSRSIRKARSR